MNPDTVVTRFAPSPTGFLHVGSVRTAIYAWLFARKHHGTFILRIEDTDQGREVAGSIEHIIESLQWLGINWDIGPIKQSDNLAIYQKYAHLLVERGFAYPDPYTPEEVEVFRKKAIEEKRPFLFRDHRPDTEEPWDGKAPLRFKTPEIKRYEWYDIVRGQLSAGEEALDDFILMKGDGFPTYNLAHIIDDHESGVTHIMRGEEFISSTPKFLSLYDALGFERPYFATMPVILGPDGKKKLSKRDSAKDILDYRSDGYLPEAMLNFLALVGWHPEGDQEIMTVDELTAEFNIAKLQKSGASFDERKLHWFNQQHIKRLSDLEFSGILTKFMKGADSIDYLDKIIPLLKERSGTLCDAVLAVRNNEFSFMRDDMETPSEELLLREAKADAATVKTNLQKISALLADCEPFTADTVKEALYPYATEVGRSSVLWPMRVALSGMEKSPDPFTLAGLLGKERTLKRIEQATQLL